MSAPMVEVESAHKWFGHLHVLRGIDLAVEAGTVTCVLGPSGSGKSTLLRCMNHLERVDAGRVTVDGRLMGYREHRGKLYELRPRETAMQRSMIGMVFQSFNLFPHKTVLENVIEGPVQVLKRRRCEAIEEARALLERVGLAHK